MVFGVILAGGVGTRMGNVDKPKQYLTIGEKPIIVHTVEKFYINDKFEKIIILCPLNWIAYTNDIFKKYQSEQGNKIVIIPGGLTRNETILNAIDYIEQNYGLDDDTVVVTHDAVRPFVTYRIIEENIKFAAEGVACDTVVPATDTIVESQDGEVITQIPDRAKYYQGQTPQSFKAKLFKKLFSSLSVNEQAILTDAAKVFVMKGYPVSLVMGEASNIKVTYPYDLEFAETLLGGDKPC